MEYFKWYEDVYGEYSCSVGNREPIKQYWCLVSLIHPEDVKKSENLLNDVSHWAYSFYDVKSEEDVNDVELIVEQGGFVVGWNFKEPEAIVEERDSSYEFLGSVGRYGNAAVLRSHKIVVHIYDDPGDVAFKLKFCS